jgi:transcriptional regulator with XRE-family HTH domain
MSTIINALMSTIGANLKQERLRLNLNQEQFADLGGVKKRAQISYEQDERVPTADYLAGVAAAGVDVQFVLTGKQSGTALNEQELELISGFRTLDERGKAGVIGTLRGLATSTEDIRYETKDQIEQTRYLVQQDSASFDGSDAKKKVSEKK